MVVFCGRVRARERGVMFVRGLPVATAECYAACERVLALTVSCGSLVWIVVVGLHPGLAWHSP